MQIKFELTKASIQNAINEIKKYQESLQGKMEIFINRLLDEGIKMAYSQVNSEYNGMIAFEKDGAGFSISSDADVTAISRALVGRDLKMKQGKRQGETVLYSPLYGSEFGSGWLAYVLDDIGGVGQGTFPGQIHATDIGGWWYKDENGESVHTYGEAPTHPMHNAMLEMIMQVDSIAREVFS